MPAPRSDADLRIDVDLDDALPAHRLLAPLDADDALQQLRDLARRAAAHLARHLRAHGEVRALLTNDDRMRAEHRRVMHDDSTTDVLSFDHRASAGAPPGDEPIDADVLVCVDEAARQARARNHPALHETLLYILHGALHCMGHDDTTPDAAQRMHALEDATLLAIGVGPIFNNPSPPGGEGGRPAAG